MAVPDPNVPEPSDHVDALLRETRAVRDSLHALIGRIQQDRREQQRALDAILCSRRLTSKQRQRLRHGAERRQPR